jgi:hypothetical protein
VGHITKRCSFSLHLLLALLVAGAILCPAVKAQTTSFFTDRAFQPISVLGVPQPVQGAIPYAGVRVCSLPTAVYQ